MAHIETAYTEEVVSSLLAITYEDLSQDTIHAAKRMVLDGVACAIAGSCDVQFQPIADYSTFAANGGSIPGPLGRRYDISTAALLVAAATHILDYDDVQTTMGGHPSSTLLPVILALGHKFDSTGEEVLRAMVLGTELDARIGRSMNPAHYGVGWHPTDVIGCLGSSLAASSLLGLDVGQTRQVLGLATSYAAGTKANFGTTTKSLHAGFAARAGVESALLVRAGATANSSILDSQFGGYFNLYTPEVDRDLLIENIGEDFIVANPGISFKLLPCCGSIHSSVWAVIGLFDEGNYDPRAIRAIRSYVDPKRIAHTSRIDVSNGLEAKFSSQYCQAVAALNGRLTLADFDDDVVSQPDRQALLRKVSVLPASDMNEWPNPDDSHTGSRGARVEIEAENGDIFSKFNLVPRGYAADPASDEVLGAKFEDCVGRDGRNLESVHELADAIMSLEELENVGQLIELIWKRKRADKVTENTPMTHNVGR